MAANLAVLYVVFGSTYLAIRVMVETIPALVGAGLRFLVAGLLLYGWCTLRRGYIPRLDARQFGGTVLIGLLVIGGGLGLLTVGEKTVPSGLAALLIASVPAWVVLLRAVNRERVRLVTGVGVVVGFAGVALLGGTSGEVALTGIVILLVAAVSEAIGSYYTPRFSLPEDPILSSAVQMLVVGPVLLLAGLGVGEQIHPSLWSGHSLLALIYLIGPGSILAYASFVWLVSRAPASIATTYAYVNPVVALFLGWLILDEKITTGILVGAILIIVGVAAVLSGENRSEERALTR
ncbi:MAG TPA: EamA family transporter [Pseudonocardiaceae bacterium]|nr:EamA family transporter [Pseudonocardiaceae bacterium]